VQDLDELASVTPAMSARDLRAICEVTERRWVSSIVRGTVVKGSLPPVSAYRDAAVARRKSLRNAHVSPNPSPAKWIHDLYPSVDLQS
jgi:hypothetical protein